MIIMSSLVIEITMQVLTAVAILVMLSSKNSKITEQIVNLILSVNGLEELAVKTH